MSEYSYSEMPKIIKINGVKKAKLSVVVPCYNEEKTLSKCVQRLMNIADDHLALQIIIVDDCSTDQSISIATELEIVAKVAHMRLRIYEMGIFYHGRTYEEGKKITAKDGLRALYCIFRYNTHRAPVPVQFLIYLLIGTCAAAVNYCLCIFILFRPKARLNSKVEMLIYISLLSVAALMDLGITSSLFTLSVSPLLSKIIATVLILVLNFSGRRYLVFPEPTSGPWRSSRDVMRNKQ